MMSGPEGSWQAASRSGETGLHLSERKPVSPRTPPDKTDAGQAGTEQGDGRRLGDRGRSPVECDLAHEHPGEVRVLKQLDRMRAAGQTEARVAQFRRTTRRESRHGMRDAVDYDARRSRHAA